MKEKELIDIWKKEESVAHIHGWDFSHIEGRYTEETDLPWNYQNIILDYLNPEMKLLDIDTGGGEFLLSLRHPYVKTSATEAYPPNIQLCRETLLPLGIDFRAGDGKDKQKRKAHKIDPQIQYGIIQYVGRGLQSTHHRVGEEKAKNTKDYT